ncbi:ArsR family transcriptional regulator [Corynebacterium hylobatis]|uniref:ArsR family transcriptional regulator n=1 Tax=Corynebacterium hylobatis TaxID=1859290 RepID=A0A430I306_9CORY|nr:winged helix-turn-helix domain-containing protein [Corynebacterium hylobatis]RSZ66132.1 ArsR family transcriptional regulator [Corynebacterium hylobatis]
MDQTTALERRLRSIEARLSDLESPAAAHIPEPGVEDSVLFVGDVTYGGGRRARYHWHRPAGALTGMPWDENLERLAALAHPLRGAILRRLFQSPATAAELVEEDIVGSTGAAYHHLGALHSGGWITREPGGRHSLRTARVIPLLSIIAATEEH